MKSFLIFLFMLLLNLPSVNTQWLTQSSGSNLNINDIDFFDINNGWAVGDNSRFFRTTNGGLTWGSATIPGVNVNLGHIKIRTENSSGLATGRQYILTTTNSGVNWATHTFESNLRIQDIGENDVGVLYAPAYEYNITEDSIVKCHVLKSTNGGNNWIGLSVFGFEPQELQPTAAMSIDFGSNSNTWYVGTVSGIYRTTDNGSSFTRINARRTWQIDTDPSTSTITAVFSEGSSFYVEHSTNAGANWIQLYAICNPCAPNRIVSGMRVLPTVNKIYITTASNSTGLDFMQQDSSVLVSSDNGASWFYQSLPVTGVNIMSVDFTDGNTGWVVGSGGTILKTTNGGGDPIGIQVISSGIPERFLLSQNYPNPFNPVTHLGFQIPAPGFTSLKIYDQLGREITVLVNEVLRAGSYEAQWNAADYPSGVYFYKLESSDFIETKKMILIK